MEGDAEPFALAHAPVDDANHFAAAFALRGQADLATGIVCGLEDDDLMATLGTDTRGLEASRAGADDDDLPPLRRLGYLMRHGFLAARCRIVNAESEAALIDAVETVIGANAGANVVLPLFHDLSHDMRVGHVGARHADHIDLAGGDRISGGGDILDLGGVKGREAGRGADLTGKVQMRGIGHPLNGNDVGQTGIGVDMAANDVQIVDQAALLQPS